MVFGGLDVFTLGNSSDTFLEKGCLGLDVGALEVTQCRRRSTRP
jgi:hypothetical protein